MSRPVQKAGKVAIIYSENEHQSLESKHLAFYLCGLLSQSGYAQIVMIPYCTEGPSSELLSQRISYIPPGKAKPLEVPSSDVTFAYWNAITECHLVVVTVNSNDTKTCGMKLCDTLQYHKNIPVFSLQRGVRQGSALSDEVETKGTVLIESVVGFAAILDPRYSALVSTTKVPSLLFQRMSKEEVKIADGPMRLLETMDLDISFRKILTPFAWGVLLYENLYALNIITKGSLLDTLSNRQWRLILALMIRENINTLKVAAKGGAWEPSILLISTVLNPKLFELALVLPNPLFNLLFWLLGLFPNPYIISPGQMDLMEGRKTMTYQHLKELVEASERHNVPSPMCDLVLNVIHSVESGLAGPRIHVSYANADLISNVESSLTELYPVHDSISEINFWLVRIAGVISFIVLLFFVFYHD